MYRVGTVTASYGADTGVTEIIHVEAHSWCELRTRWLLIIVTKMFPHFYNLNFIYIKAALQRCLQKIH